MNDEQKARVRLLVDALRSGKYQQTYGMLRDSFGFCCLGVACDIYRKHSGTRDEWDGYEFIGAESSMPPDVYEWFGFPDPNPVVPQPNDIGRSLAGLNDSGKDFKYIADAIEQNFLKAEVKS